MKKKKKMAPLVPKLENGKLLFFIRKKMFLKKFLLSEAIKKAIRSLSYFGFERLLPTFPIPISKSKRHLFRERNSPPMKTHFLN